MATNKFKDATRVTVTAKADVKSGQFYSDGALFGVAITSAQSGEEFELELGGAWVFGGLGGSFGAVVYQQNGELTLERGAADNAVGIIIQPDVVRLNDAFGIDAAAPVGD